MRNLLSKLVDDKILMALIALWSVLLVMVFATKGIASFCILLIICIGYFLGLYVAGRIVDSDHDASYPLAMAGFLVTFISFPFIASGLLFLFKEIFAFILN